MSPYNSFFDTKKPTKNPSPSTFVMKSGFPSEHNEPPTFIIFPKIQGDFSIGGIIRSSKARAVGNPMPYVTYQWYRGPNPIPGATSLTYTITEEDAGFIPVIVATAVNEFGQSQTKDFGFIIAGPVVPEPEPNTPPVFITQPTISGSFAVGQTLTGSDGVVAGNPTPSKTRQWLRGSTVISGATNQTYVITSDDRGYIINYRVTATNSEGNVSASVTGSLVPYTLGNLSVSSNTVIVGQAFNATISGKTPGSTLTLSGAGAAGLTISGTTISGTPTTAGDVNITETLADAVGSPKLNSNLITVSAPAGAFISDANTYFFDFTSTDNIVDNLGVATVARVKEKIGDKVIVFNDNKQFQPIKLEKGITFNSGTGRVLNFDLPNTLSVGKNGFYLAFTINPSSSINGSIFSISSASSTTQSRLWVDITGSRNIRLKYGANDSSTLATIFSSSMQLAIGTTYAVEILFDFDADTYTLWIDKVNQNVAVTGGPWSNYPSTAPREIKIGNNSTGTLSLDAVLNNIVFQDGVPSNEIRNSVSDFQQIRKAI